MYGLNRERRIFDKILYEVDSSDIHDNYYSQFYHPLFHVTAAYYV
jgi:hypothetical protein